MSSLAVLLFFAGLFISSFWFSDRWEDLFKENIEFLVECKPNQNEGDLKNIQASISQLDGVRDLRMISPEEAMKIMREELGEVAFPDTLENPFRASFRFKLAVDKVDTAYVNALDKQLMQIKGVNEFYYPEDLYSSLRSKLKSISMAIAAIGGILILLILVMIHHQIRMYIMQHRYHIRTMSLVGATRNYIRKPFITEVLKMSSFSILVASIAYLLILLWIGKLVGQSLFETNLDMTILGLIFIVVLGILMSFSAAWAAIQRYLDSTDAKDFI